MSEGPRLSRYMHDRTGRHRHRSFPAHQHHVVERRDERAAIQQMQMQQRFKLVMARVAHINRVTWRMGTEQDLGASDTHRVPRNRTRILDGRCGPFGGDPTLEHVCGEQRLLQPISEMLP